jgi:hypothetical protein
LGLEVRSVGIKDVILPGEMKDLMNRVTEAKTAAAGKMNAVVALATTAFLFSLPDHRSTNCRNWTMGSKMLPLMERGKTMGQPVKLSDELVEDARAVAPISQRSIAGQIEFWASLGKSIEPLLRGDRVISLQVAGSERPLSLCLKEVETARGRKRLRAILDQRPYPHYKPVPGHPDLICRIENDGTETVGRFVGREFKAVEGER